MSSIKERIFKFRKLLSEKGLDAYIIPSGDPHQSEYVAPRWKGKDWISGFTGSAGVVVVTQDHAGLWTDSRYFIQAEKELDADIFTLHKIFDRVSQHYFAWLMEALPPKSKIGFDGLVFSAAQVNQFKESASEKEIDLVESDLLNLVWHDRPGIPAAPMFLFDDQYNGLSRTKKLNSVRDQMKESGLDYYLLSSLDDIAWLLNIRSSDIEYNPVCMSYVLISSKDCVLFVNPEKVKPEDKSTLDQEGISFQDYEDIRSHLECLDGGLMGIDPSTTSSSLVQSITIDVKEVKDFTTLPKSRKNNVEISHFRNVMIKDAHALLKAFRWMEQNLVNGERFTEYDMAQKIMDYRAKQELYFGESFAAIVGYRGNGAIVHYKPEQDTAAEIENHGFLLVDCGAQYLDGTTDITRTFCFDEPSIEQKIAYTAVLKGHIQLAMAKFPKGTNGGQLDALARKALWSKGLNYLHGTGHGVGFFLNVHEKPQGFAPYRSSRIQVALEEGMVTSNEPGYYKENEFGIRIENLILTRESDHQDFLEHETLSLFPIETKMIIFEEMRKDEVDWLNAYHRKVFDQLAPVLDADEKAWLQEKCRSI